MRGRPPLPMETIIDAALRIVDEEGGEALSMRALARRLDSGTATIYRHFANRTEVVAHVVDRVFGEVQLDDPALARMPWQDACIVSSRALFDALRRHPNVAMLLADQIPVGPQPGGGVGPAAAIGAPSKATVAATPTPPSIATIDLFM
ncbi:Putative transcriptional regulator%2C TetR family [Mycobacteroides abscessus]|nr:Putative transcriptional regulator%2C TetR family [Mycobacteroides abscessus]